MSTQPSQRIFTLRDFLWGDTRIDDVHLDKLLSPQQKERLDQYLRQLSELHTIPASWTPSLLWRVCTHEHEIVLCLCEEGVLLGTAQASLLFPAMRPTVQISNVVVDATRRREGIGEVLMLMLRRLAKRRWASDFGQLKFELTSREQRGTASFYERLGYQATPTVRYTKG